MRKKCNKEEEEQLDSVTKKWPEERGRKNSSGRSTIFLPPPAKMKWVRKSRQASRERCSSSSSFETTFEKNDFFVFCAKCTECDLKKNLNDSVNWLFIFKETMKQRRGKKSEWLIFGLLNAASSFDHKNAEISSTENSLVVDKEISFFETKKNFSASWARYQFIVVLSVRCRKSDLVFISGKLQSSSFIDVLKEQEDSSVMGLQRSTFVLFNVSNLIPY